MIIDRPVAILTLVKDPSACPIAVGIKTAPCIDECVVCIWPKKNKKYLASLFFSHGLQSASIAKWVAYSKLEQRVHILYIPFMFLISNYLHTSLLGQ